MLRTDILQLQVIPMRLRGQRGPAPAAQAGNQGRFCQGAPGEAANRAVDNLKVNQTILHPTSTGRAGIRSLRAGSHRVETSRLTLRVLQLLLNSSPPKIICSPWCAWAGLGSISWVLCQVWIMAASSPTRSREQVQQICSQSIQVWKIPP